ncbi:MAG: hypothetical protein AAF585_23315 [Verrucomicrobiota bacterium]
MRLWSTCAVSLAALVLSGCVERIVEPQQGDLTGEWRVNLGRAPMVGNGAPIFAELRITNTSKRHVRLSSTVSPELSGSSSVLLWSSLTAPPISLEPGESTTLAWLMQGELQPGSYQISTAGGSIFVAASPCVLTLTHQLAPAAAVELYEDQIARFRGDVESSITRLRERINAAETNPTDLYRLADLLESSGQNKAAHKEYLAFAQAAFGDGPYPAWLEAKLTSPSEEEPAPAPENQPTETTAAAQ